MSDPQSKAEIIDQLRAVQHGVSDTVSSIPAAQSGRGNAEVWSPSDYLKHLLLAVKPFAKASSYPPEALQRRFGAATHPSLTYAGLVAAYQSRLADGIRAEDYASIMPTAFRIPEEITDEQAYLVVLWNEAHDTMIDGLAQWSEADLDAVQILHPALSAITVREMLFFTIYHNTLHWNDIRAAGTMG